jgi:hypothetical protein
MDGNHLAKMLGYPPELNRRRRIAVCPHIVCLLLIPNPDIPELKIED